MAAPERPAVDPLPWVRFHWKDWRSSTARASLPLLARLAYLELIFAHNSSPDCTVPDDPRLLAALVDLPLRTWNRLAVYILPHVPVVSPGKRQNPRCYEEWKKGMNAREAAIEAGRRGGRSRASRARVAKGSLEGGFRVAQASLKPSASAACSEASSQKKKVDPPAPTGAAVAPPEPYVPTPYVLPDADRDLAIAQRDAENERLARKGLPLRPDLRHHFGLPPMNRKVKS